MSKFFLTKLGTVLFISSLLCLQTVTAEPLKKTYKLDKVADNTYIIHGPLDMPSPENQGFMNNPGFIVTSAGIVVVDPGSSVWVGQMLLGHIKSVSDKPVVAVFNTHIHGDHWLGNQAIQEKYPDVKIYAHPRTIERITEGDGHSWVSQMESMTEGATKGTKIVGANTPIDHGQSIKVGDTTFNILHNKQAHTDTDIMIHALEPDVVFLGDNVGYTRILRLDDGHFQGNIEAIDMALALNAKHYVPGHGPTGGAEVPSSYQEYLQVVYTEVKKQYEEGLSDFEIKPLLLPQLEKWKTWSGLDSELGKHISLSYLEIESDDF